MRKQALMWLAAGVVGTGLIGCQLDPQYRLDNGGYTQVEYTTKTGSKRIFVFASQKSADAFTKENKEPKMLLTKIGFGPNGETVLFEADETSGEVNRVKEFEVRNGSK
jgi:hypothetical protein